MRIGLLLDKLFKGTKPIVRKGIPTTKRIPTSTGEVVLAGHVEEEKQNVTAKENMRSLQVLLTVLDGQKLNAGYLTPAGSGTALETMIDLKRQADGSTLNSLPTYPPASLLFRPAWVSSLRGQNAIYLNAVDGNLDLSNGQPAYLFASP